jgi:hypothetical protein
MAEIKEEIIEFNPDIGLITRYSVIVECASATLSNHLETWESKKKSNKKREFFTPEKLAFYFY